MDADLIKRVKLLLVAGLTTALVAGCSGLVADGEGAEDAGERSATDQPAQTPGRSATTGPRDATDASDMPSPGEPGGLIINPTPEPPPPAPQPPPAMYQASDRGAVAAAGHYLNLMSYAFVTGEVSPMLEMSAEVCKGCSTVVRNIETIHDKGGRVAWPELSMEQVVVEAPDSPDGVYVLTFDRRNRAALFMPGQEAGTPLPNVYRDEVLELSHDDGGWRVVEFRIGEPEM